MSPLLISSTATIPAQATCHLSPVTPVAFFSILLASALTFHQAAPNTDSRLVSLKDKLYYSPNQTLEAFPSIHSQ